MAGEGPLTPAAAARTQVRLTQDTDSPATGAAFDATPYLTLDDFLGTGPAGALLDHACRQLPRFEKAGVGHSEKWKINPAIRSARLTGDLGPHRDILRLAIRSVLPRILDEFGMKTPVEFKFEMTLVNYRDGDFYRRHIDTFTGGGTSRLSRLITCVYYVHRQPRVFTGGDLRLHSISGNRFIDIESRFDRLAVFPSWLPHEVLPVGLQVEDPAAGRFAVNIWVRGTYSVAAPPADEPEPAA